MSAEYLDKTAIKEVLQEKEQELENTEAMEIQEAAEQARFARLSVEEEKLALDTEIQVIQTP